MVSLMVAKLGVRIEELRGDQQADEARRTRRARSTTRTSTRTPRSGRPARSTCASPRGRTPTGRPACPGTSPPARRRCTPGARRCSAEMNQTMAATFAPSAVTEYARPTRRNPGLARPMTNPSYHLIVFRRRRSSTATSAMEDLLSGLWSPAEEDGKRDDSKERPGRSQCCGGFHPHLCLIQDERSPDRSLRLRTHLRGASSASRSPASAGAGTTRRRSPTTATSTCGGWRNRQRLYVRLGIVLAIGVGLITYLFFGIKGPALSVPLLALVSGGGSCCRGSSAGRRELLRSVPVVQIEPGEPS